MVGIISLMFYILRVMVADSIAIRNPITDIYPSLDQCNWPCAWCLIPEHHHISLKQKKKHIFYPL